MAKKPGVAERPELCWLTEGKPRVTLSKEPFPMGGLSTPSKNGSFALSVTTLSIYPGLGQAPNNAGLLCMQCSLQTRWNKWHEKNCTWSIKKSPWTRQGSPKLAYLNMSSRIQQTWRLRCRLLASVRACMMTGTSPVDWWFTSSRHSLSMQSNMSSPVSATDTTNTSMLNVTRSCSNNRERPHSCCHIPNKINNIDHTPNIPHTSHFYNWQRDPQ